MLLKKLLDNNYTALLLEKARVRFCQIIIRFLSEIIEPEAAQMLSQNPYTVVPL
jgi:hypothetical protein